eukprot:7653-Hanusia_phi.AAC.1
MTDEPLGAVREQVAESWKGSRAATMASGSCGHERKSRARRRGEEGAGRKETLRTKCGGSNAASLTTTLLFALTCPTAIALAITASSSSAEVTVESLAGERRGETMTRLALVRPADTRRD